MAKDKRTEKSQKVVANEFEMMLNKSRERQRAQELAQKLLGKDYHQTSAGPSVAGSLSSRSGIKKRASTSTISNQPKDLASRIAVPGTRKAEKIAAAIKRSGSTPQASSHIAPVGAPKGPRGGRGGGRLGRNQPQQHVQHPQQTGNGVMSTAFPTPPALGGLSIRGLAGPYIVAAENFADGTTAADIESAVTPIGGSIHSCKILKTKPIIKAEIVFESREGAERVVQYFNGKTADSRMLHFYPKIGGGETAPVSGVYHQPQPRQTSSQIVDGSHGFDDPMETDLVPTGDVSNDSKSVGGLYSDRMVPSAPKQPKAFKSWRGGRPRGGGGGRGGN